MSQEKVDALLTIIDAFNRRDAAAMAVLLAPDATIVPARAAVDGTV